MNTALDDHHRTIDAHEKIALLREKMRQHDIDIYMIPRVDRFQGEEVTAEDERLHFLTGFTGSAGVAFITLDHAVLFVDGRYHLIAQGQVDTNVFDVEFIDVRNQLHWMKKNLNIEKPKLGLDPWLVTKSHYNSLRKTFGKHLDMSFKALPMNLVDAVWDDRPSIKRPSPIMQTEDIAGASASSKILKTQKWLKDNDHDVLYCFLPDQVMWLLNWRGRDLACTPFFQSYAMIDQEKVTIYCKKDQIDIPFMTEQPDNVIIKRFDELDDDAHEMAAHGKKIALYAADTPIALLKHFEPIDCFEQSQEDQGDKALSKTQVTHLSQHPVQLWKACKNAIEQHHIRQSHLRDGAALVRFLYWLETSISKGDSVDEMMAERKLHEIRAQDPSFISDSFEAVSASGPNAAMPHYRARPNTNRAINKSDIYKIDSGGQYSDGTTDITRTICFTQQSDEVIDRYTRVLKGHIAVARAKFPRGSSGSQIDVLARQFLWQKSLDFKHGTGHGVGFCLSVHEGPCGIYPTNKQELLPGMFLSNEPGFYKDGEFGIRIENLILVQTMDTLLSQKPPQSDKNRFYGDEEKDRFLGFETVSFCPIDTSMINVEMLTYMERKWLNDYHQETYEKLAPVFDKHNESDKNIIEWLFAKTRAV